MFIELTKLKDKDKQIINLETIIYINKVERGTMIAFTDDEHFVYEESYGYIQQLIKNEVAAERGY